MRYPALFLTFLLLCLALPPLEAKFTEKLTVQVFDQLFRPGEGAEVYAEYQLNSITGTTRTKPKPTNSSGTADLVIANYEEIENSTDYSYTLFVKYGNMVNSTDLIADPDQMPDSRVVTLRVPSCYLFVYVRDQNGQPLNAQVSIGDRMRKTDKAGMASFQVPLGDFTITAESASSVGTATLRNINSDQTVLIEVGIYHLQVRVSDDNGKPLNATVEVDGISKETDDGGLASFENLSTQVPQVIVKHGDAFRRFTPNLRTSSALEAVFDLHKPVIKELHVSVSKTGVGTISLFAEDPGAAATGVDSISVTYEANGVESSVPAYSIGYNSFEAKMPAQLPNTVVKYLVRVSDKEGNTVSEAGTYVVSPDETPPDNTTYPPPPPPPNIPVEAIIIGVLIAAIVIFAALYYFMKMRRSAPPKLPEMPKAPPEQPA
jgi:hypothetical protein